MKVVNNLHNPTLNNGHRDHEALPPVRAGSDYGQTSRGEAFGLMKYNDAKSLFSWPSH